MKITYKKYFIAGLAVLLPVIITIYILIITFKFSDGIIGKYINPYLKEQLGYSIPGLGLLLTALLVLFTGVLATNIFTKQWLPNIERWFMRLPLIQKIYSPAKTMVDFLFSPKQVAFKKVVLIEYPRKGLFSIGFITCEHVNLKPAQKDDLTAVLVPSTPSPFTGYFVLVPASEIVHLDMSIEEGMKAIISGGILFPQKTNPAVNTALPDNNAKNLAD